LLDPFAGYRLASGHPFFHLALFICSFFVRFNGDDSLQSAEDIVDCFTLLRYAHLTLIVLAVIEAIAARPS